MLCLKIIFTYCKAVCAECLGICYAHIHDHRLSTEAV